MEVKLSLIFLMVALAAVLTGHRAEGGGGLSHHFGYMSAIGDFLGAEEELMLDSEASRRALVVGRSYISYGALKANQVPCGRRGQSYYNCQNRQRVNPYRRACTAITHCARYTD